jgi:hypothetical protein
MERLYLGHVVSWLDIRQATVAHASHSRLDPKMQKVILRLRSEALLHGNKVKISLFRLRLGFTLPRNSREHKGVIISGMIVLCVVIFMYKQNDTINFLDCMHLRPS